MAKISTTSTSSTRTSTLNCLTPTEFENLIFDLLVAKGLKNVTWRTPGADGGRDIEAELIEADFSGTHTSERWFIECKKYRGSVDWPTIYAKVAYADSQHADYLLMCSPSKYTPAAITQATNWNSGRRALKIRLWAGHELEQQLNAYPDIQRKYGLISALRSPGRTIVSLALALSKSVASHHSSLVFDGLQPDRMLLASQSLADLLLQRMADLDYVGYLQPVFKEAPADERWSFIGKPFKADFFALQAFLGYLFALTNVILEINGTGDYDCTITGNTKISGVLERYSEVFNAIALWGDFEYEDSGAVIEIKQRTNLI